MSHLRVHNLVVSLDGYATGEGQSRYSIETVTVPSGATHLFFTR
jgi:hypothetical protein